MQLAQSTTDSHSQLRALYHSLLDHQDRFHEFKQLLSLYPTEPGEAGETEEAAAIRTELNDRIREWIGAERFSGLSAMQVMLWRTIVVQDRFNVALAPWKEANTY
jgi:hypothetical protein